MISKQLITWMLAAQTACLMGLAACSDAPLEQRVLRGQTMGTTFSVKLVAPPVGLNSHALQADIEAKLESIENMTSTYLTESELSRINRSQGSEMFKVSTDLCTILNSALELSRYTNGAFDITIGPLVNAWGFGPAGSVGEPPTNEDIERLQAQLGHQYLATDCSIPAVRKERPGLYLDLSAYAKGYAVDQLALILNSRGLSDYVVEVGGELRMRGLNASREPWAIAIERPRRDGQSVQSVVRLTDQAVATSGDYRNYFEHAGVRYSHTIDPNTGSPVTHSVASVTVVAESAAYADAMATALLVLGPVDGLEFAERENIAAYFLMYADDRVAESMTSGFAERVFQ